MLNRNEKRSIKSYDKKADNYEATFDGKFTLSFNEKLFEKVEIPPRGALLDVACGNGRLLKMLSRKFEFNGFGVDISSEMVANASRQNPGMIFKNAACNRLPFTDNFFDVLTVCTALHHFPDTDGFAKEALRVLKPNGMLYVCEVYYPSPIRVLLNPFLFLSMAGDVRFYSENELIQLFQRAGFGEVLTQRKGKAQIIQGRKS